MLERSLINTLGYTLEAARDGENGPFRRRAVFTCVECNGRIEFKYSDGMASDPEVFARKATRAGWIAYPYRKRSSTYCPDCRGPRKAASGVTKETTMATTPDNAVNPLPAGTPVLTMPLKDLTSDQRMAIRTKLDEFFDDRTGSYLDGYSDQRVAELCGVPRLHVERIREAAFGPIRQDPEMEKLRQELVGLRTAIEGQQKGLDKLKAEHATLSSRIETYLAKSVEYGGRVA